MKRESHGFMPFTARGYMPFALLIIISALVAISPVAFAQSHGADPAAVEQLLQSVNCPQGPSDESARYSMKNGYVNSLGAPPGCFFPVGNLVANDAVQTSLNFLRQHSEIFGIKPAVSFQVKTIKTSGSGSFVKLTQHYNQILVWGAEVIVQVNFMHNPGPIITSPQPLETQSGQGVVSVLLSSFLTDTSLLDSGTVDLTPGLDRGQAAEKGEEYFSDKTDSPQASDIKLVIYPGNDDPVRPRLAYEMTLESANEALQREVGLFDADTGERIYGYPLVHSAKNREIYDSGNTKGNNPGTLERSEGDAASSIADVNDAYNALGFTYDYFFNKHGRDSIDNAGLTMSASVRYCPSDPPAPEPPAACPMNNAFWNGARMFFGDGYATIDVSGHELAHGVTQYEANLVYANQPGAINESYSDIFGKFIDLTYGSVSAANRWLLGWGIPGGAIRDMQNPPAFSNPDRMGSSLFVPFTATPNNSNDQGGVHSNSGVGNKLCYLLTDGDTFNGHTVTGMGIDPVSALFYEALVNLLTANSDYADLGIQLMQAAVNLGWNQAQRNNLKEALCAVEIQPNSCTNDLTVCVFYDKNANGVLDAGEDQTLNVDWPVKWTGYCAGSIIIQSGDRCIRAFSNFPAGSVDVTLDIAMVDCKFDSPNGDGRRFMLTTPKTVTVNVVCNDNKTVRFGVVDLHSITVEKWHDTNMNGVGDGGESKMNGWPIKLQGPTFNGIVCPPTFPVTKNTKAVFEDLLPGSYTVSEDLPWESVEQCQGVNVNRVTFNGKRWQATGPISQGVNITAGGSDKTVKFTNVCLGTLTACVFNDKNMSGTRQPVAENYTDLNGNGKWDTAELYADINKNGVWDAAEPFTDTNGNGFYESGEPFIDINGNGCWDQAEPLRDENGNGIWDAAEPWTDSFANGTWDAAEPVLSGWKVAACGTAANGDCVAPLLAEVDGSGCVTIKDVPPGNYRLYSDNGWCSTAVNWCNGGVAPPVDQRKVTFDGARWLATTDIVKEITLAACQDFSAQNFGFVKLGSIEGTVALQSCPGDPLIALPNWEICLKVAEVEQKALTFTALPLLATDPDCVNLSGNCSITASDGSFRFGELVPGIYQPVLIYQPGYAPMGNPVGLCVPFRVVSEDVVKDYTVRDKSAVCTVYQAYPAGSPIVPAAWNGFPLPQSNVTAVPGILSFVPGSKWENFALANFACQPYCLKNVILTKEHPEYGQCAYIFPSGKFTQQGTRNIRTWWPLMYEPVGTKWTLKVQYGTPSQVVLPGETQPSAFHEDVWGWQVGVSFDSLDNLLDLFHTVPWGLSEVPLISDEQCYYELKSLLAAAKAAPTNTEKAHYLLQMDLNISNNCVTIMPKYPLTKTSAAARVGITNTTEHPACCKLMNDLDWLIGQYGSP